MVTSLIVYSVLLLFSLQMTGNYSKLNRDTISLKNPYIIGTILIYTLICGVRYDVGMDYMNYWDIYNDLNRFKSSQEIDFQEPGWALFTKYLAENGFHYSIYFSAIALVQITMIVLAFKNYPKLLPYAIWAFYCLWLGSFQNTLRQSIALVILLYVALNIDKIKIIPFIIIVTFASLIHKSAFIMMALYPILRKQVNLPTNTFLLGLIYLILCGIGQIFDLFSLLTKIPFLEPILIFTQYDFYMKSDTLDLGLDRTIGFGYILKIIINLIIIFLSKRKLNTKPINNIGSIFWLYYTCICISAAVPTSILLARPLSYLSILGIPVYAQVLYNNFENLSISKILSEPILLTKNKKNSILCIFMVIGVTLLYFIGNAIKPEAANMEYKTFF